MSDQQGAVSEPGLNPPEVRLQAAGKVHHEDRRPHLPPQAGSGTERGIPPDLTPQVGGETEAGAVAATSNRRWIPGEEVHCVICTFNRRDDVLRCVASALDQSYPRTRVVVVDNGSTDGSADALLARFGDRITVLENRENLGGAGGFNTGVRWSCARGAVLVHLLDSDVVLHRDCVAELVRALGESPAAGAAGSKSYFWSDKERLWCAGAVYRRMFNYTFHIGYGKRDGAAFNSAGVVPYMPACSLMVKREVIDRVGLMDDALFLYQDDVDWCLRMSGAGYDVRYVPSSVVWHDVSPRADAITPLGMYYASRNLLVLFSRYRRSRLEYAAMWPAFLARRSGAALIASRKGRAGARRLLRSLAYAVVDFAAGRLGKTPRVL
ncbi:MAG: glycosyltransferase family 2 protein [Candidatus Schekmanbacteria bacterium]|nr:glycosyltransferase family 2 protein [Candidatus Schekmanbacteria bacterium]